MVGLVRTGRPELAPSQIAVALIVWQRESRRSRTELGTADEETIGFPGGGARDVLDAAVRALPHRRARQLRQLIAPFDRAYAAKTLPDPFADPALPWRDRRIKDPYQRRALTPRERDEAYRQAGLTPPP